MAPVITKEMILDGIANGKINIEEQYGSLVCTIGDYYVFFAGSEMESYSVEEYLAVADMDETAASILAALEGIRDMDLAEKIEPTEYLYYYYYLKEESEHE